VYAAAGLPSPCLFGLARPAIYVTPETGADPNMLRHVIAHEYTHYRHGDHIWSLLRCAALAAHWWNPLVWVSAVLSRRDAELACDEGALKRLGDGERLAYGNTLLALVTAKPGPGDLLCFATTMAGDKKSLKERVSRIACAPKRWLWAALAVVLVMALACVCAFGQAEEVTEPEDTPEPDPTPSPTRSLDFEEQGVEFVMLNETVVFDAKMPLAPDLNRNGIPETLIVGSLYLKEDADRIRNEGAEIDPVDMGVEVWEGDELLWTGIASYIHVGENSFLLYSEGGEDYLMEFDNHGGFGQARADYRLFTLENGVETTVRENHVEYHYCTDTLASVKDHFDPEAVAAFVDEVNGLLAHCALLVDTGWNYRENSLLVDMTWLEGYAPGFQWADGQSTLENLTRFKMAAEHPLFARDMNRNMKVEMIRVTELDGGAGQRVELWEEGRDGAETVWADEGYYAHAGANAVFLCTLDDKDYLLRYRPYMSQGVCDYSYELFTLTKDGQEKVVRENHLEFQINFTPQVFPGRYDGSYDPEAIAAFMDEINGLLASSTQLINTDSDLLGTFQELGRLEDDLWWLDHWEPVFVRDRDKSLLENLKAFQTAMTAPTVQGTDQWDERGEDLILTYQGRETRFHGLWKHLPGELANGTVIDLDGDGRDELVFILLGGTGTSALFTNLYVFDAETLERYDYEL
ncbi:MAG: M56 family metallopeptidase, partial [Oscillospiraceae bacterium]|nr:M56 family metallopeptidase [Oscillospiraceae bacterium]